MKNYIKSWAIFILLVLICLLGMKAEGREVLPRQYPQVFVVTDYDTYEGLVTVQDWNGFSWQFWADGEDWERGDLCAAIVDSKGTSLIFDDEIITAKYSGWVNLEDWGL